jgi:two-component system, NarL family, nitrate/nitrite response regulator NarL
VIIARDPLVRSGLVAVLSVYPGLVLKGALEAPEPSAATADVVVWDVADAVPPSSIVPVLALVGAPQDARRALRSGARGALSRSSPAQAIGPAALAVAAGHWVVDQSFALSLFGLAQEAPVDQVPALLSPREQEVIELLSEGLSNRDIAERLGISRHTAKFHVNAILDKLGATTRTEAVVLAARSGVLSL